MSEAPPQSFPEPVAKTITWLRRSFTSVYRQTPPDVPDRATRREFGYILWPRRPGPPPFVRHKSFRNAQELRDEILRVGPHSLYYSTAYYRSPGEQRMIDKQWLGAELIFDLDADHLDQVEAAKAEGTTVALADQLRLVKKQFQHLLDDFLLGDLGIDPKDMFLTFSGGRGYHAHITSPEWMKLGAQERREIVDYVTGKFPAKKGTDETDTDTLLWQEHVASQPGWGGAHTQKAWRMNPIDAPGWGGRITRSVVQALRENVLEQDAESAVKWLQGMKGVGGKGASEMFKRVDERFLERLGQGYADHGKLVTSVIRNVMSQQSIALGKGETDEPVTADTKRLIRLPGSIHGKTGLLCKSLHLDELDAFDPFEDALAFPTEQLVRIKKRDKDTLTLGGQTVTLEAGEEAEVPFPHAVFWCSRQQGTLC